MQTHDFFSRMIALNAVGPNVQPTGDAEDPGVRKVYVCGACDTSHPYEYQAEACCPVEVFEEYLCPACDEGWDTRHEAADCCAASGKGMQPMQCPVCMRSAESFEIATDCCLHTHPTISAAGRERIAQAVEEGMPWQEAVEKAAAELLH